jgi:hypothetical protein
MFLDFLSLFMTTGRRFSISCGFTRLLSMFLDFLGFQRSLPGFWALASKRPLGLHHSPGTHASGDD